MRSNVCLIMGATIRALRMTNELQDCQELRIKTASGEEGLTKVIMLVFKKKTEDGKEINARAMVYQSEQTHMNIAVVRELGLIREQPGKEEVKKEEMNI